MWSTLPDEKSEHHHPHAPERCSPRIRCRSLSSSSSIRSLGRCSFFVLMLFYERETRRQDGGKCQKKPSHHRAEPHGNSTGRGGNETSKNKTKEELPPSYLSERCKVNVNVHVELIIEVRTTISQRPWHPTELFRSWLPRWNASYAASLDG